MEQRMPEPTQDTADTPLDDETVGAVNGGSGLPVGKRQHQPLRVEPSVVPPVAFSSTMMEGSNI